MSSPGCWTRFIKPRDFERDHVWVVSSAQQRKNRRAARKHAKKMIAAGCPEKAAVWLKRARNG